MMARPLSKGTISKARELVLCGKSKHSVAKDLGIGVTTIYKHTSDIPGHKHNRRNLRFLVIKNLAVCLGF